MHHVYYSSDYTNQGKSREFANLLYYLYFSLMVNIKLMCVTYTLRLQLLSYVYVTISIECSCNQCSEFAYSNLVCLLFRHRWKHVG